MFGRVISGPGRMWGACHFKGACLEGRSPSHARLANCPSSVGRGRFIALGRSACSAGTGYGARTFQHQRQRGKEVTSTGQAQPGDADGTRRRHHSVPEQRALAAANTGFGPSFNLNPVNLRRSGTLDPDRDTTSTSALHHERGDRHRLRRTPEPRSHAGSNSLSGTINPVCLPEAKITKAWHGTPRRGLSTKKPPQRPKFTGGAPSGDQLPEPHRSPSVRGPWAPSGLLAPKAKGAGARALRLNVPAERRGRREEALSSICGRPLRLRREIVFAFLTVSSPVSSVASPSPARAAFRARCGCAQFRPSPRPEGVARSGRTR